MFLNYERNQILWEYERTLSLFKVNGKIEIVRLLKQKEEILLICRYSGKDMLRNLKKSIQRITN